MLKQLSTWVLIFVILISSNLVTYNLVQRKINSEKTLNNLKFSELEKKVKELAIENTNQPKTETTEIKTTEIKTREIIREKSQEDELTSAVAKASPAVVSIVVSKDVPQLEVTYKNPFGDDPNFGNFGFRIPVYRQKGTVRQKVGAGTGFLVTSNGLIVTNRHVVADQSASYTVLLSDGTQLAGKVVYLDTYNDLALVKIEGNNFAKIDLGDSSKLKLGQSVLAIGNALGEYNNSVSTGIVSGLNRSIEASGAGGKESLNGVIQTDAAINPGNSGGPLLDLSGKALGVNVATVRGSNNISFAIPINDVKKIIENFVR